MRLSTTNGTLYFDDKPLTPQSIDRLRLSKNWQKVLSHDWNKRCSICDLHDGRFLISGGHPKPPHGYLPIKDALIFDSEKDEIVSKFHLTGTQTGHTSLLVGAGKVLLAGGDNEHLEIVDVDAESTIYYCENTNMRNYAMVLGDSRTALLLGGLRKGYTSRTVTSFDLNTQQLNDVGKLKIDRGYGSMENRGSETPQTMEFTIDSAVQPIGDNKFLISGGNYIHPYFLADFSSGGQHSAEIFHYKF